MIREFSCYDIVCDRCGEALSDVSADCHTDTDSAEMAALQSGWKEIDGKHYCPDCYEVDEETDEYLPKEGDEEYCGECDKLLYEDACGYGRCKVNGDECYCGDLCHLIHGKP